MSGNPFRGQRSRALPFQLPIQQEVWNGEGLNVIARRDSQIKQVRIETPPQHDLELLNSSYALPTIRRVAHESHAGSPPPSPLVESGPEWVFGSSNWKADEAELFQDEDVAENTRKNSVTGTMRSNSTLTIVNPFEKTFAAMEFTGNRPAYGTAQSASSERTERQAARGQLDVDSFTQMLMAGIPSVATSKISPSPAVFGSSYSIASSAKDASYLPAESSIVDSSLRSWDSLFEAPMEVIPRASYEEPPSSNESNDKHRNPVSAELTKSSPPHRRNGKSVSQRNPLTVPFDDFSPSDTLALAPTLMGTPAAFPPTIIKKSDFIKPLPNPPTLPISQTILPIPDRPSKYTERGRESEPGTPSSSQHTSPESILSRRDSSSNSSAQGVSVLPWTGNVRAGFPKVPPPPPAPRKIRNSTSDQSFTVDTTSITSVEGNASMQDTNITSAFAHPKPSNVVIEYPGSSRSSSISISARKNNMPPPPPPPRRRGSSKSSLELQRFPFPSPDSLRRLSGEQGLRTSLDLDRRRISQEGARNASGGALSQVSEDDDGARVAEPRMDVLEDLEALQREVDALRVRYKGPSPL